MSKMTGMVFSLCGSCNKPFSKGEQLAGQDIEIHGKKTVFWHHRRCAEKNLREGLDCMFCDKKIKNKSPAQAIVTDIDGQKGLKWGHPDCIEKSRHDLHKFKADMEELQESRTRKFLKSLFSRRENEF